MNKIGQWVFQIFVILSSKENWRSSSPNPNPEKWHVLSHQQSLSCTVVLRTPLLHFMWQSLFTYIHVNVNLFICTIRLLTYRPLFTKDTFYQNFTWVSMCCLKDVSTNTISKHKYMCSTCRYKSPTFWSIIIITSCKFVV